MSPSTISSLIILRRISFLRIPPRPLFTHPFSSSPYSLQPNPSPNPPHAKPTSLSARFTFVFDQIDAIERESSHKDDTLQRIRTWRESKKTKSDQEQKGVVNGEVKTLVGIDQERKERDGLVSKEVEVVHPWVEWIELMERLVQQNYFDHVRKDEEKMLEDSGFRMADEVKGETVDLMRDWRTVQTACVNFGKDRFDILRSLSRHDIQILVGYGCPTSDKKVVFSAKLLRKYVHLNEGDVCSSCSLRSSCERGFLLTNKEDEARTIDVMRILFTYGFDPVNGSVVNDMLLKKKSVKTVIRKLLHEVVKLSAVPIDPNLSPPVIKKPPPKVKQPPPTPRRRVGRDDVEMKQGDWLCPKCDFMNFAKNTVCLQCDVKRPQRQLLPGEWECPQCNYLNYRRNTVCFHCEHKRPPDEFTENQQNRHRDPNSRPGKIPNRSEFSNAWNFDFDDNESDGADVAAFEYGDSRKPDGDSPLRNDSRENLRKPRDDLFMSKRTPSAHEEENYDHGHRKPATGFDDFDDEDDDDVDSYEVDTQNDDQLQKRSSIDFSDVEGPSDSEDAEDSDDGRVTNQRKSSKTTFRKSAKSGSDVDGVDFDSDNDLPVHTSWKSSHVAEFEEKTKGSRVRSFVSDDDFDSTSDSDDSAESNFSSRKHRADRRDSSDLGSRKRRILDSEDDISGLDSDDDDRSSFRNRSSRGGSSRGRGNNEFSGGSRFESNGKRSMGNDFNRSSQRSRGNGSELDSDDEDRSLSWNRSSRGGNSRGRGSNEFSGSSRFGSNGRRPTGKGFERNNDRRPNSDGFENRHGGRKPSGNPRERFGSGRRGSSSSSYKNQSGNDRDHYEDDRPRPARINVR